LQGTPLVVARQSVGLPTSLAQTIQQMLVILRPNPCRTATCIQLDRGGRLSPHPPKHRLRLFGPPKLRQCSRVPGVAHRELGKIPYGPAHRLNRRSIIPLQVVGERDPRHHRLVERIPRIEPQAGQQRIPRRRGPARKRQGTSFDVMRASIVLVERKRPLRLLDSRIMIAVRKQEPRQRSRSSLYRRP
jgi:hypothetical protein